MGATRVENRLAVVRMELDALRAELCIGGDLLAELDLVEELVERLAERFAEACVPKDE